MKPGMVVLWKKFAFEDGTQKDKLFIMLSHPRNHACLAVKTTSQQKWRDTDEGCHNDKGYFFVKGPSKLRWFNVNTWVIMEQPLLFDCDKLKAAIDSDEVEVKTYLGTQFISELRNCLSNSQDISEEQLTHLR